MEYIHWPSLWYTFHLVSLPQWPLKERECVRAVSFNHRDNAHTTHCFQQAEQICVNRSSLFFSQENAVCMWNSDPKSQIKELAFAPKEFHTFNYIFGIRFLTKRTCMLYTRSISLNYWVWMRLFFLEIQC